MAEEKKTRTVKTTFEQLAAVNVSEHLDRKPTGSQGGLNYLSWTWAIDYVSRFDPDWKFRVIEFDPYGVEVENGHGAQYQRVLGGTYMVHTEVTLKGETKRMWLPIMDAHNAAMKDEPYEVTVKTRSSSYTYTVPAVDAMALNKTIMRCLVKNLAMFGLGLYVFSGEDLPFDAAETVDDMTPAERPVASETASENKALSLEDALEHKVISGAERFRGMKLKEFNERFIELYAEKSAVEADRTAANIVLNAIKKGEFRPAAM